MTGHPPNVPLSYLTSLWPSVFSVASPLFPQEGVDADLRPGFELVLLVAEGLRADELRIGQAVLARGDGGALEVVEVHDAQVDPADRGRVVVDQADQADRAVAI